MVRDKSEEGLEALLQLKRGLFRERAQKYLVRFYTMKHDQIYSAPQENPRFARAGTGRQEQWAVNMCNRFKL